jgi:hypothetical protein
LLSVERLYLLIENDTLAVKSCMVCSRGAIYTPGRSRKTNRTRWFRLSALVSHPERGLRAFPCSYGIKAAAAPIEGPHLDFSRPKPLTTREQRRQTNECWIAIVELLEGRVCVQCLGNNSRVARRLRPARRYHHSMQDDLFASRRGICATRA